jgi:hypothetical protein
VLPAVFEFVADKPYAVKVCPHGEFFVFNLRLLAGSAFLRQRLMVEGQGKNYVAPYFPGMQLAVETSLSVYANLKMDPGYN